MRIFLLFLCSKISFVCIYFLERLLIARFTQTDLCVYQNYVVSILRCLYEQNWGIDLPPGKNKVKFPSLLTHWGRVTHIRVGNLTTIGSDNGLLPGRRRGHYLNQCWIIVNWTFRNKLQWNLNRNSNIFIQENAFKSVVCETAAILSRPQCVNRNKTYSKSSDLHRAYIFSNVE